ncbi:MAG: hypothetical protein H6825_01710 [Planctomycetes bacterium]|nr:hypothetical protein [Planctomycetota bacterium]
MLRTVFALVVLSVCALVGPRGGSVMNDEFHRAPASLRAQLAQWIGLHLEWRAGDRGELGLRPCGDACSIVPERTTAAPETLIALAFGEIALGGWKVMPAVAAYETSCTNGSDALVGDFVPVVDALQWRLTMRHLYKTRLAGIVEGWASTMPEGTLTGSRALAEVWNTVAFLVRARDESSDPAAALRVFEAAASVDLDTLDAPRDLAAWSTASALSGSRGHEAIEARVGRRIVDLGSSSSGCLGAAGRASEILARAEDPLAAASCLLVALAPDLWLAQD